MLIVRAISWQSVSIHDVIAGKHKGVRGGGIWASGFWASGIWATGFYFHFNMFTILPTFINWPFYRWAIALEKSRWLLITDEEKKTVNEWGWLFETEGALECPTKSAPPFVSTSPAPHLCEEVQPKNAGAQPPRYFCVSVPDEGGGRRGWSDGRWWSTGAPGLPLLPDSLLVGTYIIYCRNNWFIFI